MSMTLFWGREPADRLFLRPSIRSQREGAEDTWREAHTPIGREVPCSSISEFFLWLSIWSRIHERMEAMFDEMARTYNKMVTCY